MANKKFSFSVTDIILFVLSVFFVVGIATFFSPCGPKDDGSWMACHWAGNAILGISCVGVVISLLHLVLQDSKVKIGLSSALIPLELLAVILPKNLIKLCGHEMMRCRSVMQPAVIVTAIVILLIAIVDIILQTKKK